MKTRLQKSSGVTAFTCGMATVLVMSSHTPGLRAQASRSAEHDVTSAGPSLTPTASASEASAVIKKYCQNCHNQRLQSGSLNLDDVDLTKITANAGKLEKVVGKLRARSMPPANAPRPDEPTYVRLATWLESELDREAARQPDPGRTESLHRLNRTEYANVIRDLLALEGLDVNYLLPPDESSYGFDNAAGVLGISPAHVERYVATARKIARVAVGDLTLPPDVGTYKTAEDLTQKDHFDGMPHGTRGGLSVRRYFPVDAEYRVKFDAGVGRGLVEKEAQAADVLIDGLRAARVPLTAARVGRQTFGGATFTYEVPVAVKAGLREVTVTFPTMSNGEIEGVLQPFDRSENLTLSNAATAEASGPPLLRISVSGPYNATSVSDTAPRQRIFVCRPDKPSEEIGCARQIVTTLARRGYRRPPTGKEIDVLLDHYQKGRAYGGFDTGIQLAIERLLSSPEFLFRLELDPADVKPGTSYQLDDLVLASRLSFFLWSSIPDDELLDLAIQGRLKDESVLERQTRRMLSDPRSTLATTFFRQWLRVGNLPDFQVDGRKFPNFDDTLRQALGRELELLVGSIVAEDRGALELLTADYTFVNERLARHYGIPDIQGSRFRRVKLENPQRWGLLGKGALLTSTSLPSRTSIVARGKFILDNFLNAPPPPPPADVPGLVQKTAQGQPRSMRESMEQHRANPVCAGCHKVMDPLGFALENFDATGAWRTTDADVEIDATGTMPDGRSFTGAYELQQQLAARPEQFVSALTAKLSTFALGRGVEAHDYPHVRKIVRDAADDNYRMSSLVVGIVKSVPFRMRRSAS